MSWGMIAAAGIAAVSTVVSSQSAKKSAKDQTKGADRAILEQERQYDLNRTDLAPFRETGSQALRSLARGLGLEGYSAPGTTAPLSYDEWLEANPQASGGGGGGGGVDAGGFIKGSSAAGLLSGGDPVLTTLGGLFGGKKKKKKPAAAAPDPRAAYDAYVAGFKPQELADTGPVGDFNRDFTLADFEKEPGYQFRMDEGIRAREAGASARKTLLSGAQEKALERFGQDYASGEYSNAYNRFNTDRTTRFNRLATLAGVGQTATNTGVAAGSNSASNISDLYLDRANASAAGRVGQTNAINQGVQTLGNLYLNRKFGGPGPNMVPSQAGRGVQPVSNYYA